MVADHSFYLITIETHARSFLTLNILAKGRVYLHEWSLTKDDASIFDPPISEFVLDHSTMRRQPFRVIHKLRRICKMFSSTFSDFPSLSLGRSPSTLVMATGLSCPGKTREGPRTGRDRTGPRDLEGPVVLWSRDLRSPKVPGLFSKVPGLPGPFSWTGILLIRFKTKVQH